MSLKSLQMELERLTRQGPVRPMAMAVEDARTIEECAIRIRGNAHSLGTTVPRGFLSALRADERGSLPKTESGRRQLALWFVAPSNPLTARVIANRVWHHLFGSGLVRTVDNFGTTGEPPSHPELLDHLAVHLRRHGWSIKDLIRTIVKSRTYRLRFAQRPRADRIDPDNRLLWRANRRRLEAESLRDAILSVSGSLDFAIGGRTIKGLDQADKDADAGREYTYVFDDVRRSVYTPVFRNRLPEFFDAFDFADPNQSIGARNASVTASQALLMMNSRFVIQQCHRAAGRLLDLKASDDDARVRWVCLTTLGRLPTDSERRRILDELERSRTAPSRPDGPVTAWERVFHGLFASIDFRYIE